jgi:hypothetical protein
MTKSPNGSYNPILGSFSGLEWLYSLANRTLPFPKPMNVSGATDRTALVEQFVDAGTGADDLLKK